MAASHVLSNSTSNCQGTHDLLPTPNVNQQVLKHDPGITVDWSSHEQSIFEDGLSKFANESSINKFIKIAALLPEKTVRDVAFRCRWWMLRKEMSKKKKAEEQRFNKVKDTKLQEKSLDPTVKLAVTPVARHGMPIYSVLPVPDDNDDGISLEDIGGTARELLEKNSEVARLITANLASYKLQENIELFGIFRDNVLAVLNGMKDMPCISQLPSLPALNLELANTILPKDVTQASSLLS